MTKKMRYRRYKPAGLVETEGLAKDVRFVYIGISAQGTEYEMQMWLGTDGEEVEQTMRHRFAWSASYSIMNRTSFLRATARAVFFAKRYGYSIKNIPRKTRREMQPYLTALRESEKAS